MELRVVVHVSSKSLPQVALLLPPSISYSREILLGIFQYVQKHSPWRFVTWKKNLRFPSEGNAPIAGAIGLFISGGILSQLQKRKVPTINVSEKHACVGDARVLPDNEAAGRMAAEYFVGKKFRNFAFSGCEDFAFSRLRGLGFVKWLAAEGFKCIEHNFGGGKWPSSTLDPLPEIAQWLRSLPKPCAVFAYADDHALRILIECERLGISVPEEIAVLGCDNDEIQCELAPIPVSSVAFPLRQLGYEAAAMLQSILENGNRVGECLRLSPTGIVSRRSTDIIAVQDVAVARAVRYISANATESINVGDVVRACGASRRYLERRFNTLLGRTPKEEIQRCRLVIAKRLLAETSLTMAEVAEASGFTDAKMLSSVFRADTGRTPSEFRRGVRVSP